mgnify:CR=1 FL=1
MSLQILNAGPLLSVQDRGRFGYRSAGVSAAGPMDPTALALANALCGNKVDAAALEFAGLAGSFKSDMPLHFAVTGGDCDMSIGGKSINPGETHRLNPDETLKVGSLKGASWGYLAIAGGIQTEPVLGSRSTHLRFGLGGLDGRALGAGDVLPLSKNPPEPSLLSLGASSGTANLKPNADPIRIMLGPQDVFFAPDVLSRLTTEAFTITPQRDRMATILDGPTLPAQRGHDIVSDGTVSGAIQVPGSGQPIVLMAECQTTGGYPKIATIISADLARFAQMPNGKQFYFQVVDRVTAEDAAREREAALRGILENLTRKAATELSSTYLLSCDLIGGIAAPDEIVGHHGTGKPEE